MFYTGLTVVEYFSCMSTPQYLPSTTLPFQSYPVHVLISNLQSFAKLNHRYMSHLEI